MRHALDAAELKFSSLSAQVAVAEWRWAMAKEQSERLVHELTVLSLSILSCA
jgi:hypothetical protein